MSARTAALPIITPQGHIHGAISEICLLCMKLLGTVRMRTRPRSGNMSDWPRAYYNALFPRPRFGPRRDLEANSWKAREQGLGIRSQVQPLGREELGLDLIPGCIKSKSTVEQGLRLHISRSRCTSPTPYSQSWRLCRSARRSQTHHPNPSPSRHKISSTH